MVVIGTLCVPATLGWHVILVTGIIALAGYVAKVLGMLFFDMNYSAAEFWFWGFDHWTFGVASVFLWYLGVRILQYSYQRGTSFCTSCMWGDEHVVYIGVTRDELENNPELAAIVKSKESTQKKAQSKGTRKREAIADV